MENNFSRLVIRIVETFWTAPWVLHPVLAFYSELIWNKSQRIRFDSNSAGGIILFKETHKIMATYANRIVMMQKAAIQDGSIGEGAGAAAAVAGGDTSAATAKAATAQGNALYENKLKGMSLVLQMLTNVLNGGYCNFGVMSFYKDSSAKTCIKEVLALAMSVSFDDIQAYPKGSQHTCAAARSPCRMFDLSLVLIVREDRFWLDSVAPAHRRSCACVVSHLCRVVAVLSF